MYRLLRKDFIERIINPAFLDSAILFFLFLIVFLVSLIYYFLYTKKNRHRLRMSVKKSFELWISKAILEEYDDESESAFHIPEKFLKHFKSPEKRAYAVDELVNSKKNLTGSAAENIVKLYDQLQFKKYSLKKFNDNRWYIKAKGIQELYIMDQADTLTKIYKHTNSSNEFVRMEAQTGVIHFSGFEGLRFLELLSYPMTEWQQIKLLEQLRSKTLIELKRLPIWLKSANDSVVIFALKLTDEFQQYHVHDEVVSCLKHQNEEVRIAAVKALKRIANEESAEIIAAGYVGETEKVKLLILRSLNMLADDKQIPFFLKALDESDDTLKLNAARTLVSTTNEGLNILEKRAKIQPDPFRSIFLHVKAESGL